MSLLEAIESETEYLETTEQETVECISIENLLGILKRCKIDPEQVLLDQ